MVKECPKKLLICLLIFLDIKLSALLGIPINLIMNRVLCHFKSLILLLGLIDMQGKISANCKCNFENKIN